MLGMAETIPVDFVLLEPLPGGAQAFQVLPDMNDGQDFPCRIFIFGTLLKKLYLFTNETQAIFVYPRVNLSLPTGSKHPNK